MTVDGGEPRLYIVGFRLGPDSDGAPEVYAVCVGDDRPVSADGRIVWFTTIGLAAQAVGLDDDPRVRSLAVPSELHGMYDVALALRRLADETTDPDATIINVLNLLLDFLAATPVAWIPEIGSLLHPLADRLTFHREFGTFIDQSDSGRIAILDAVRWAVGAIVLHSRILRPAR